MLNKTGLRFRDEFVRHKILDIIGDLALLGMPILGKVVAERSGHIMHAGLMSKLLRMRSAWDIVDMQDSKPPITTEVQGLNPQNTVELVG
jgi:UDP-3-O-[3-hydroxymyristoyl] N-acetylglucosamine deacetylase